MILLSHPTADDAARHVALALNRAGVLGEFWTCAAAGRGPRRFSFDALSDFTAPLSIRAAPPKPPRSHYAACRSLDRIVSTRVASAPFRGVYAYEHGAEATFRIAGRHGLLRVYEIARGHWRTERELCAEEAELEPAWASTLDWPRGTPRTLARTDAELQQADLVIVPSTFVLRTLDHAAALPATIAVLPPSTAPFAPTPPPPAPAAHKLRALFVGSLGQLQGLSYLFRACRQLRDIVDLTVIAPPPCASCPALDRELREVRWRRACSADELRNELATHDVLLSPALFDGFNPILLDAMAAGLPIIATPHTAAPDFVDDGCEGYIVPTRSSDALIARLESLHRDPERRAAMSAQARERARRHDWEHYERALAASIATALTRR